ncbi:MAG: DUF4040 domain-containing protein [Atribacterota bacterium]|nr:DUF4040 domain-containing protein [Atribacterota bacterium]
MSNLIGFSHIIVISLILIAAFLAINLKDILSAVIALAASSLLMSLEFYLLQAPDVAIAEAAVGAALTTAIYIFAIKATKK